MKVDWSYTTETDEGLMVSVPLTAERFPDMEAVFGERGTPRRCFCMYWRRPDGGFGDERDNRDRFAERLSGGRPPGLLGYIDREPVGWVQLGPRSEFPTLNRSRLLAPVDEVDAWSINCFVVRVGHRRSRIGKGLLESAIHYAIQEGASVIEAYPVDGKRSGVGDYFTGTMSMFDEHGFVEITRRNDTRPIVRLEV